MKTKKLKKIGRFITIATLTTGLVFSDSIFYINTAHAANTKIRQEINITDTYLGSASGSYATSSAKVQIDTNAYTSATCRWFQRGAVRPHVPTGPHLSGLGSIPAQRRRQYAALRRSGQSSSPI